MSTLTDDDVGNATDDVGRVLGGPPPQEAVIRLDPRSGALFVAFAAWADDAERVFVVTRD